jgi:SAM-dependent methyltransferase
MVERGYQSRYSDMVPVILDEKSRLKKAEKILRVLEDYLDGSDLRNLDCLDTGCSGGIIDFFLAGHFKRMVGLDIDKKAIYFAKGYQKADNMSLLVGDAMCLPFGDCFFDVVICNHVYAHVPEPLEMMREIYRVLKPAGVCYFAAGNRFSVIEGNYMLPFLSWLPPRFASLYLKTIRGIPFYYERHFSLLQLRKLVKNFEVVDYTLKIIFEPEKFGHSFNKMRTIPRIFRKIVSALYPLIPTYIWLLVK